MDSKYLPILSQLKTRIAKKLNSDTSAGSIFRNMILLATGSGAAKVIGLFTAPIITRIYLPEHMGVLSVFTALTALLVPFGTLLYDMAIPLPKDDGMAANLAVLCGLCLLVFSTISFFVFWLFAPILLGLLSMEQLLPYWWLLPLAIAGTGMYQLLTNWAVREKAFKPIAKTKVWQAVIAGTIKISLGFIGFKPLGLLIGQLFTQAGGILTLSRVFWGKFKTNFRHVSSKCIISLVKQYADFPKYRLPSQFLLIISSKAPLLFFAWQFGAEKTGQLGLALTMLALPMTLFGQTTGQAYYAEIAKIGRRNPEKIYQITKSITKNLFIVSIPPFLVLLLLGPWLFQLVFGEVWLDAGKFASILAFYLLTQFVSAPLVNVLTVFNKQNIFLAINVIRLLLVLLIFSFSVFFNINSSISLIIYSITLSVQYVFILFMVFKVICGQIK